MTTVPALGGVAPVSVLDCAALVRAFPWESTAFGPIAGWDPVVASTVDLVLACPIPMVFAWGDDYLLIYNDAYADVLGHAHPKALGHPAAKVFGELWDAPGIGNVIDDVYATGRPFLEAEAQISLPRGPAFFTRGHSAVRDRHGAIAGVLTVAAETTQVTRRLQSLGELTAKLAGALTLDDVARVVLAYAMASFEVDHCAFAVDDGGAWRYVRRIRGEMLDETDERLPPLWKRIPAESQSPLVQAAQTGRAAFTPDGAPLAQVASDRHERRIRALAALPLRAPSLIGALTMGYRAPHTWLPAGSRPSTARPSYCSAACSRSICPSWTGSASPPGTTWASTATPRVAISTTHSSCPVAGSPWCSATWPATTYARRQ